MQYEGYRQALGSAECLALGKWIVLSNSIVAIQLRPAAARKEHFSAISRLPRGAELRVCDNGFNSRSVKVQCSGQLYYVFVQDLEDAAQGHLDAATTALA